MGDVKFCMAFLHSPGTFHAKDKLVLPADVSGKNIRPAQATIGRFVSMLGGASVWVPAPEARETLARVLRTPSPSPGTRSTSSASTASPRTISTSRSTSRPSCWS